MQIAFVSTEANANVRALCDLSDGVTLEHARDCPRLIERCSARVAGGLETWKTRAGDIQ